MNTNIGYKTITHRTFLRLLMMSFLLFISGNLFAIDFEVNGIIYHTSALTNTDVWVTGKAKNYTGDIVIPESISYQGNTYTVTIIDEGAFYGDTDITSIVIPPTIGYIDESAFSGCSNLDIVYISSIESWLKIGFDNATANPLANANHLFINGKEVNDIIIPDGVTTIDDYAFYSFRGLKSVTLPNTLEWIYLRAFTNCEKLDLVVSKRSTPPHLDTEKGHPFSGISSNAKLVVPKGCIDAYSRWKDYFKEIVEEYATYSLVITSVGSGYASYEGTSVRGGLSSFTLNEGTSATITFYPDDGYRIKSVKVNNTDVTSSVSNNSYTISSISGDTTVEVEFEAIPPTTYTLTIKAMGNGSVSYDGTSIRSKTSTFTVNEGTNVSIIFTPDNSYRIKSVKENNTIVTSYLSSNTYTISSISRNTTVEVEFEAIPPTTYTMSIKAIGNGSASYDGTTIRSKTSTFTVNEGTNVTISFAPDNGYRIKSVKVNNADVTSSVSNNSYTINNISKNTNVEVEFEAIPAATYTLSITASGSGSASYNGTTVRSKTSTFTVNEGTNVSITFTPDNGYRIKSVKENNTIVTSYVSSNAYTINNISRNTIVEVEFEAIPPTTYTLSIKATGNGSVSYDGVTIRSKASTFVLNEGANAVITFLPDNGNQIKNVKVNGTDVTFNMAYIGDNGNWFINGVDTGVPGQEVEAGEVWESGIAPVVIGNIREDMTVEAEFEPIPATTYMLSISAYGGGSVYYEGETINNSTNYYTVNDGTYATIYFTPDDGYRLKSVKENYYDVTSQIGSNSYTTYISGNTSIEVEFEEISVSTYSLSVKASGSGSVSYNGSTVRNRTTSFTVEEGTNATITFTPDNGYRLKSVVVNNYNVTSSVSNNSYTISYINRDTNVEVEFEAIPATTYTLSVKAVGSGSASYNGTIVRDKTSTFSVNEGTNATITFTPDNGYRIKSLVVNNADVTSYISNNTYSINSIAKNTTLVVEFEAEPSAFAVNGVNYAIRSNSEKTVAVSRGNYGAVLDVPAKVTYQNAEWKVTSIESNALSSSPDLCAIIWNPEVAFTENVRNPNLLLYVKAEDYAPTAIKNVVVNGSASSITLTDAASGNNFYCPEEFTAKSISYTHHYTMDTGLGESKGWETIALPFDVQKISHQSKGEIVPFANWKSGDSKKPFWLMEFGNSGWKDANSIKAYTPYIISMPNHEKYKADYKLNGNVTFSAANVKIGKTQNYSTSSYGGKTFVPNYSLQTDRNCLALNVNNDYITYQGSDWGSKFSSGRDVHPFEAYMTTTSGARSIAISDDMTTTGIRDIMEMLDEQKGVRVYNLKGQLIKTEDGKTLDQVKKMLTAGVYIINGQKVIIK
jgi:carbon monoxide dehydrogenase subunit G